MKFIPNAVSTKFGRQLLQVQKFSPQILFGAGVLGMVGTTVLACKATLRVEEVLAETKSKLGEVNELQHDKYSEEDRLKDKVTVYTRGTISLAKLYAPSIALGTLSICALGGAHNILSKRNAALTAAYASVDKAFSEYRKRVENEFGSEKEEELRQNQVVKEKKDSKTGKSTKTKTVNDYSQYAVFFDKLSTSFQPRAEYNMIFLRAQQNYVNDLLRSRGHVFLNEVYDLLGVPRSQAGAVVGWVLSEDGDNYIDFGIFDGDKERARAFVNGDEDAILLDFNVDGVVFDKI